MNKELIEHLETQKILYSEVEDDVIDIQGFGKVYIDNMEYQHSIFRNDADDNMLFNCSETPSALIDDGINYVGFKFGNNWYYVDLQQDNIELKPLKYIGNRRQCEHSDIDYVNLGVHTPYELLNGSFAIEDWIKKAKYLRHTSLGVCDMNTMASLLVLQKSCKSADMKYIFGYSLTFREGENLVGAKIYVQTQQGLQNLLRIQKIINVDNDDKIIDIIDLLKYGKGNVIVFDKLSAIWLKDYLSNIDCFYNSFDNCYYQLDLSEYKAERIDRRVLDNAMCYFDFIYDTGDCPPILINDCYYLDKDDAKNKITLNKIASGAAHEQSEEQYYKDIDELYESHVKYFSDNFDGDDIFRYACENTVVVAQNAQAKFETDRNFMPQYDLTPEEKKKYGDRHKMFLQLLEEGFTRLVPEGMEDIYRKRLDYEIYVLESTNNVDYMLVQYDCCNWARDNGILVGCGRGSAGGCLVLYLLGITLVDPIKYNLIFERFLLPERAGLYPDEVTVIGEDVESTNYMEIKLDNGQTIKVDADSQLRVKRGDSTLTVYADELEEGDDILFDNRDIVFTLNEL